MIAQLPFILILASRSSFIISLSAFICGITSVPFPSGAIPVHDPLCRCSRQARKQPYNSAFHPVSIAIPRYGPNMADVRRAFINQRSRRSDNSNARAQLCAEAILYRPRISGRAGLDAQKSNRRLRPSPELRTSQHSRRLRRCCQSSANRLRNSADRPLKTLP